MKNAALRMFFLSGLVCAVAMSDEAEAPYATSFEEMPAGPLKEVTEGSVVWKGLGKSEITTEFRRTGRQSLRIFGGTDNTIEIALQGALQECRGIEFYAERWTSAQPFEFRLQANVQGEWKEISNFDQVIVVGRGFRSHIVAQLPEGCKTALRIVTSAPGDKGTLIDDVKLLQEAPSQVTTAPKVATEPIAKLVYKETLFKSGTTNIETLRSPDGKITTVTNLTHTFRIPAIITAANGDLLAACDARRDNGADLNAARDIDIALRRSSDHGKTWTPIELICDLGEGHPASDPSLVLDETTGEIFCFYNYMDRSRRQEYRLWLQSSKDHGKTWSRPRDITEEITLPEWKWNFKFMTSGHGCQTRTGVLLHTLVRVGKGVHVFGSKDHGETWMLFNPEPMSPADESKVIELADGRLMVNARVNGYGARHVHVSEDDGRTWTGWREDQLVDPGCNGAILRYPSALAGDAKTRLLFSNANAFGGRKNLAVRISYDEGMTWSDGKVIDPGDSAYSDLTVCKDGSIGILYEPGYGEVRFASVTLEDLTDGKDRLPEPNSGPDAP